MCRKLVFCFNKGVQRAVGGKSNVPRDMLIMVGVKI